MPFALSPAPNLPALISFLSPLRPKPHALNPYHFTFILRTPCTMIMTALALLDDRARTRRIGQAGRAYVERNPNGSTFAGRLKQVYRELSFSEK